MKEMFCILREKGFSALFVGETDNTYIQFFRYLFVGGAAFLVDFGLLTLLVEAFHVDELFAAGVGFVAGLAVNYLMSTFWIFKHSKVDSRLAEFVIFAVIGVVGLLINEAIIWLFQSVLGPRLVFGGLLDADKYYLIGKLVATVVAFVWNFAARKVILYRRK